ncbi:MAG: hypothetical protein M3463_18080 [Verrucomicrobiota bacterium]|nr:hypothetical protein [Verrucomicrobiota bacterium]
MKPQDAKNSVDSAVPKAASVPNLSEEEKKALELGELAEHSDGEKRERLQEKAEELGREQD